MGFVILTKELWDSYTPEQQEAYRNQLFITRRTEKDRWPIAENVTALTDEEYSTLEVEYQTALLAYYRIAGFPHYQMTEVEKEKKFKSLLKYDHSQVYKDHKITQTMHGLGLAWTYFPHMWEVQCNNMMTPMQVFNDDKLLMKAIIKRMKWGTYISDSGMRKALRSFSGTQSVSNFRPTAAATVYHNFLPEKGGVTWDMSSGFGGRLLGAMACDRVLKYIGTDPSTYTMDGLRAMEHELQPMLQKLMPNRPPLEIELHKCGSEDYIPEEDSLDLCFTSPPYFDCEKYSDEPTQSYKRFPSQNEWLHGFMKQTLANCHRGLKYSGYLVVNIAGVKTYKDLFSDFVVMAESNGWKLVGKADLLLSKMMGTRGTKDSDDYSTFKAEPVFIFVKRPLKEGWGVIK